MTNAEYKLTLSSLLNIVASSLLILNLIIYLLRSWNSDWWSADYEIYNDVDAKTHFLAFASFVGYMGIYYLILRKIIPRTTQFVEKKNYKKLFYFIIIIISVQIYFAIVFSVGVAGGTGRAPMIAYVVLLFSFDGVYYAYALTEKNKFRLIAASGLYTISNIVRGWAGFVVFIGFIYFIRLGIVRKKQALIVLLSFTCLMPILFVVRDEFRGGYSKFNYLQDSGLVGVTLYWDYFI